MIYRIEVTPRTPDFPDLEGEGIRAQAQALGIDGLSDVRVVKIYKLEGAFSAGELQTMIDELLVEKLWQNHTVNEPLLDQLNVHVLEIARKPGVMDTETETIHKAITDLGIRNVKAVGTGKKYLFFGTLTARQLTFLAEKILMNKIVDRIVTTPEQTLIIGSTHPPTKIIPLRTMNAAELMDLSRDALWLNRQEMQTIQTYFQNEKRDPTDVEVEILAQTWSEHCCHKTFTAELLINGKKKPSLMSRLKKATEKINAPWCLSVFVDNAGVIEFDKNNGICGKVETHNSPSAIEPYGGAMTGSGGVFRDIMGCGLGSKVIGSTDIFCFAPPDTSPEDVPTGCIHPRRMLTEVVRGVKDYGNRMGIPTNNGSIHFHPDYRAKPSVIVGAFGIIPKIYVQKKKLRAGDRILTVGGKTGRDGIHGVTFASGSMSEKTETVNASAVQIGNAIEEKRMFDAILACRNNNLLRFVQDCGGGGYSSAIGEIAEKTGADVQLDTIPLKYPGLASWEIWISESQERMVLVVDPKNVQTVQRMCQNFNVTATDIGTITDTKRLRLYYGDSKEADLDVTFLHDGRPCAIKKGIYKAQKLNEPLLREPIQYESLLKRVLAHGDICSKEPIVRLYDHEVQGTSVVKPYAGETKDVPNDAAVIAPVLGKKNGMAIAHGMIPRYNRIDPYIGAASAIDEAVRNLVAVGVDPTRIALIDNFIWPTPDELSLGDLDRAVDACYDTATTYKMPFVSGKDSLSSTYTAKNGTVIKIPPTLCISAFAPVVDIYKTITADLKQPDNLLFIVGETAAELGGSVYYDIHKKLGKTVPDLDPTRALKLYKKLYRAIQNGLVVSAHDLSEGGLGVTIAEMSFGIWGASISLNAMPTSGRNMKRADYRLFSESNARFVVEVPKKREHAFLTHMGTMPTGRLGVVTEAPQLVITHQRRTLINVPTALLKHAWAAPMKKIFG